MLLLKRMINNVCVEILYHFTTDTSNLSISQKLNNFQCHYCTYLHDFPKSRKAHLYSFLFRNGRLRKKEFKSFRRKVFRLARNKICARNFWQYCDMDNDAEITRGEWSNCLGVNINSKCPSIYLKLELCMHGAQQPKL